MAVAVKYQLPTGVEPDSFLREGVKSLWILPHGLSAMRHMLLEPSTLVVSFHSPKIVCIQIWQKRLTEAYGQDFGALVTEENVRAVLEQTKDDMRRLAVHRYYYTEGMSLVEDAGKTEAKMKRSLVQGCVRPIKQVAVAAVVSGSARVERVGVYDEAGEMHRVDMRQSQLELQPIQPVQPVQKAGLVRPVQEAVPESSDSASGAVDIYAQGDYAREIAKFLRVSQPWRPPPPQVAPLKSGGDVNKYLSTINVQALGSSCISKLVPPVLKQRDAFSMVADDEHRRVLAKVNEFFRTLSLGQAWSLCPFNDMQFVVYHASSGNKSVGRSYLELVRRALLLEGEIARMVTKLYEVVRAIPSMIVIPDVAQGIARLLLERNCGRLSGQGADGFLLAEPREDEVTRKLRSGADAVTLRMLDFLLQGRGAAFGSEYTMESPLAWLLPTVAFLFEHRELLAGAADKDNAKKLRGILEVEWEERRDVYWLASTPLAKYGAVLTR